jgi:hypothetical protein
MGIFVGPGYKATKTIPAVPGLHPPLLIVFTLASAKDRCLQRTKSATANADAYEIFEVDLISRCLVSINKINSQGHPLAQSGTWLITRERISELRPAVRKILLDLILGITPEDAGQAEKPDIPPVEPKGVAVNSSSGSFVPSS